MYISSTCNSPGTSLSNSKLSIKTRSNSSLKYSPYIQERGLKISNCYNFLPGLVLDLPSSTKKVKSSKELLDPFRKFSSLKVADKILGNKNYEIESLTDKIKKIGEEIKKVKKEKERNSIFLNKILKAINSSDDRLLVKASNIISLHLEKTRKNKASLDIKEITHKNGNSNNIKALYKTRRKRQLKYSLGFNSNSKELFNVISKKVFNSHSTRDSIKDPVNKPKKEEETNYLKLKSIYYRTKSILVYLSKHN